MAGGGVRPPIPHGRGGSVSRRDHNQAARTRPQKEGNPSRSEWWRIPPLRCNDRNPQGRGLSSVSLTADSSLCGGSLLAALPAKPPLKGEVPAKRAEGFVPHPARPRRLCQPPWTHASRKKPHPPLRRNQLRRSHQLQRQLLFGREGSGGRGASLREAASPPRVPYTSFL